MATRMAVRSTSRRLFSSGKVLSEEEKAAENVYIKKIEQEKLQKLARKGPNETPAASSEGAPPVADVKPDAGSSSNPKVSTDKFKNYAVATGVVTLGGALGWYLMSKDKKKAEQVHD